jgi:molybdenum cofactor cytidylyltransferase
MTIAAIIPAAGRSVRMGSPKPMLEFHGEPLLSRLIHALADGGLAPIAVVAPSADSPHAQTIAHLADRAGAIVITPPSHPPDMRASVELALKHLISLDPSPSGLAVCPADSPAVSPEIVTLLRRAFESNARQIIVPRTPEKRAHPVLIPWPLALEIPNLPRNSGINTLLDTHPSRVVEIPCTDSRLDWSLNTPADYQRWIDAN